MPCLFACSTKEPTNCLTYLVGLLPLPVHSIGSLLRTKDFQNEMIIDEVSSSLYFQVLFIPKYADIMKGDYMITTSTTTTTAATMMMMMMTTMMVSLFSA